MSPSGKFPLLFILGTILLISIYGISADEDNEDDTTDPTGEPDETTENPQEPQIQPTRNPHKPQIQPTRKPKPGPKEPGPNPNPRPKGPEAVWKPNKIEKHPKLSKSDSIIIKKEISKLDQKDAKFVQSPLAERRETTAVGIASPPKNGRFLENIIAITALLDPAIGTGNAFIQGLVNFGRFGIEVTNWIKEFVEKHEAREGFLRGLLYEIQFETGDVCNCLVFNLNKRHEMRLKGIKFFKRYEYERAWFGVWVVEHGSFKNKDLFKNDKWGFVGDFQKNFGGGTVTFNHRPCPAVPKNKMLSIESHNSTKKSGRYMKHGHGHGHGRTMHGRTLKSGDTKAIKPYPNSKMLKDTNNATEDKVEEVEKVTISEEDMDKMSVEHFTVLGAPNIGVEVGKIGLKVAKIVDKLVGQGEQRRGFLTGLMYDLFYQLEEQCNLLIHNIHHWHVNRLTGILFQTTVKYEGQTYGVYVAQGGRYSNLDINPFNWPDMAQAGDYRTSRNHRDVTFIYRRSCRPRGIEV